MQLVRKCYQSEELKARNAVVVPNKNKMVKEFEELIMDVNSVLFYLSNVEVQLSQQKGEECWLVEPIEIVLSITDVFKWRDQLMDEYGVNIPESV